MRIDYMYKIFLVLVVLGHTVQAQNVPNGSTRPAATAGTVPSAYTNSTINYIRTWEPSMPTSDSTAVRTSTDVNAVKQNTQYLDGLGRPLQTVSKGITPLGKDLVAPVVYDAFGREQYKYLPYVPQSGNTNDGKFKTDPFNGQKAFYQITALNPGAAGESIYYSQTGYEASPLNRSLKSYAPGNSWALEGGNKPMEQQYLVNTVADSARIWDVPTAGIIPTSGSGRVYAAGVLYKDVSKDERGIRTVEFKDKDKRVVLKKTELTTGAANAHAGWLCTYYVYDDLGNLRCVIPPKAVELVKSSWVIDTTTAKELCFFYRYDARNRMIMKRVPGADSTEMVYDIRDRLVFTRDGNMRSATNKQWLVTFYDGLNRPTMTALYNSSSTRDALQTSMNGATSNTQSISYTFPGVTDMEVASFDGRAEYEATNSITFEDGFDTGTGATTMAEINSAANQGLAIITATNPLPNIQASALTPLTYTFYDNYSFSGVLAAETADFGKPQAGTNLYAEPITGTSNMTKGMVTGTKIKVLGTNDGWLTTTTYYNDKGRVIQTLSDNTSGGKDIITNLYDFNGKVLSNYARHSNLRSGTTPKLTLLTMISYDAAGRVKSIKKRLNDSTSLERTIADNSYDELGRLQTKRLGVTGIGTQLETLNYEYNIRGWLKAINKGFVNTAGSASNWFGQELSYDYGFQTNQFNGNIAGNKWKSRGDTISRVYGYLYDNANRLTSADFWQQNKGSSNWTKDQKDFSVDALVYDPNGNILSIRQKGMDGTTIQTIDSLKYGYLLNSNKLSFVTDKKNNTLSQLGDFKEINNNETADYAYDANGNLSKDLNKNIAVIRYNHLNLPDSIVITGKGTVKYVYDAAGNKLRKIVTDNTSSTAKITSTDYFNGFVYRNDTLEVVGHEEGRIRPILQSGQPVAYYYDYFAKDHLGNVRMVLTEQTDLSIYTATMEMSSAATEAALFSNVEETRTAKPAGYPEDKTTNKNEYVAKLNAKNGGKKIGPSVVLKVMAGDTIQIGARAFYKSTGPKDNKSVSPEDMVASLLQAFGGKAVSNSSHASRLASSTPPFGNVNGSDYQRLKEKDPDQNQQDKPKAYLNFVLFDEQFNLVENNSGVRQVKGEPDELQTLAVDKMPITANGFMYVYTSNETEQDVLFDNLTVAAASGPLLEETHYYPFGLTMAGISSNALKGMDYVENRFKFNGKELQNKEFGDGSGLEWYDYGARMYDQQIGRWHVVDGKAELYQNMTPYNYAANTPVNAIDPDGNLIIFVNGFTPFKEQQGTAKYWREYRDEVITRSTKDLFGRWRTEQTTMSVLNRAFDLEVSKQLGDQHRYYVHGGNSVSSAARMGYGYNRGYDEAAAIIESLHRTNGVIDETIKVITHSMGGAYGNGYVKGLKKYLDKHPELKKQVKITLVVDFDPFQASQFSADPNIDTEQYLHKGKADFSEAGWLANQEEKGVAEENLHTNSDKSVAHSIFSFFDDISNLQEGSYKWDGKNWVKQ